MTARKSCGPHVRAAKGSIEQFRGKRGSFRQPIPCPNQLRLSRFSIHKTLNSIASTNMPPKAQQHLHRPALEQFRQKTIFVSPFVLGLPQTLSQVLETLREYNAIITTDSADHVRSNLYRLLEKQKN